MHSRIKPRYRASLRHLNTFGVDVTAAALVELDSLTELVEALEFIKSALPQPILVLGDGSNILFTKNFPGTVVRFRGNRIKIDNPNSDAPTIRAEAGANWHRLVLFAAREHLWGIENLALIPGTCGAAPIQNIGAYGVELSKTLQSVQAIRLEDAQPLHLSAEACELGYRTSLFKERAPDTFLITHIELQLSREPNPILEYPGVAEELDGRAVEPLSIAHAVARLRQAKLPDPQIEGNAGSFFKNPRVNLEHLDLLLEGFPDLPNFHTGEDEVKLSAAWLIEQCGWKGHRTGDVGVSERHSLVLVNYGGGTGQQIFDLAMSITGTVQEKFGVWITPEPRII